MSELEVEEILSPRREWVDDSCYRINRRQKNIRKIVQQSLTSNTSPYTDNEDLLQCDDVCDYEIEYTDNGRFKTYIRLPQAFFAYIIGTKGSRRKKLEDETKTDISIPRGTKNNFISICGNSERSIVLARQRLEMIGYDLRSRHEITDFVSIPLITPEIKDNFMKFKELVLQEGHIDGVHESIFQKVDKIHLTIGVLVLLDDYEKNEATAILNEFKKNILEPQLKDTSPVIIKMKGLEYMNDDPSQVDVLYAKVHVENHENEDILQKISDDIVDFFSKKGLMKKERDHVKLHATLINTRYRKIDESEPSGSSGNKDRRYKRISFDARPIMAKYSNFEFGSSTLDNIHLSHRSSSDCTGYYEPIHKISCA